MAKCANVADTLRTTQNFETSDVEDGSEVAPYHHRVEHAMERGRVVSAMYHKTVYFYGAIGVRLEGLKEPYHYTILM
jgi:hypothetical protein